MTIVEELEDVIDTCHHEILELKKQIEDMSCCGNCNNMSMECDDGLFCEIEGGFVNHKASCYHGCEKWQAIKESKNDNSKHQ